MKKYIFIILMVALVAALAIGCKKAKADEKDIIVVAPTTTEVEVVASSAVAVEVKQ